VPFATNENRLDHVPITLWPPSGPGGEPPGRPVRVWVQIEVCQRRKPARRRLWPFWAALIGLWLLLGSAMGQSAPDGIYDHWQDTRTGWQGQVWSDGRTTDADAYGPRGQQQHCHTYTSGKDRHTTCR
jgi:hypothetical protein